METDSQFFNKPRCKNCGSPHQFPCPYCTPKKEYQKALWLKVSWVLAHEIAAKQIAEMYNNKK